MEDFNSSYILLIRHGERGDHQSLFIGNDFKFSLDPELTQKGIDDARITGEYLKKEYIDKKKFQTIKIFSSPFIRCMQTAGQIAKAIDIDCVNILYGICEKLGFEYCKGEKPFNTMYGCQSKNKEEIENFIGRKLNYEPDEKQNMIKFPEKYGDCYQRFNDNFDKFIDQEKNSSTNNLIILVSHGIAFDICRKKFNSLEEILIDYACISCIQIDKLEDRVKLILNAYNKHVDRKRDYKLSHNLYVI